MTGPAYDEDNPLWTADDFARARPVEDVLPPEIAAQFKRSRGRPRGAVKADRKQAVSLRLDQDVVHYFKAGGPGWQSRINETLRASMR